MSNQMLQNLGDAIFGDIDSNPFLNELYDNILYNYSAFMDCTIAASRGIGKSIVPTIIVIMGSCVFRVIWVYTIFAYFGTIASLYLLYAFSWSITAIAEIIYFKVCFRKLRIAA